MAKQSIGGRILHGAVMAGLAALTGAAAFQTWKQVTLPDFRNASANSATAEEAVATIEWNLLRELDAESGRGSPDLQRRNGKLVRIPGFVVPLEDNQDRVSEFLLVPYAGACIHTPPPPPNQIVQVRTTDSKPVRTSLTEPVWVIGELQIARAHSQYGASSYQIRAMGVEPYKNSP